MEPPFGFLLQHFQKILNLIDSLWSVGASDVIQEMIENGKCFIADL